MFNISFKNSEGRLQQISTDSFTIAYTCEVCNESYSVLNSDEITCPACEKEREMVLSEYIQRALQEYRSTHPNSDEIL